MPRRSVSRGSEDVPSLLFSLTCCECINAEQKPKPTVDPSLPFPFLSFFPFQNKKQFYFSLVSFPFFFFFFLCDPLVTRSFQTSTQQPLLPPILLRSPHKADSKFSTIQQVNPILIPTTNCWRWRPWNFEFDKCTSLIDRIQRQRVFFPSKSSRPLPSPPCPAPACRARRSRS